MYVHPVAYSCLENSLFSTFLFLVFLFVSHVVSKMHRWCFFFFLGERSADSFPIWCRGQVVLCVGTAPVSIRRAFQLVWMGFKRSSHHGNRSSFLFFFFFLQAVLDSEALTAGCVVHLCIRLYEDMTRRMISRCMADWPFTQIVHDQFISFMRFTCVWPICANPPSVPPHHVIIFLSSVVVVFTQWVFLMSPRPAPPLTAW